MEIKIYAEIEVPVDERFSRTDYVTITLGDEAISLIAKAIAAQQSVHPTSETLPDLLASLTPEQLSALEILLTPLTRG